MPAILSTILFPRWSSYASMQGKPTHCKLKYILSLVVTKTTTYSTVSLLRYHGYRSNDNWFQVCLCSECRSSDTFANIQRLNTHTETVPFTQFLRCRQTPNEIESSLFQPRWLSLCWTSDSLTILFHRVTSDYPTTTARLLPIESHRRRRRKKGKVSTYSVHWVDHRIVMFLQSGSKFMDRAKKTVSTVLYSPTHQQQCRIIARSQWSKLSRTVDHFTPTNCNYSIRVIIVLSGL